MPLFEVRTGEIGLYDRKSQDALIRRYWKYYRWATAKYGSTSLNKYVCTKNKYKGKHRNIIKALARNKSPESRERLEAYKLKMNLN